MVIKQMFENCFKNCFDMDFDCVKILEIIHWGDKHDDT